MGNMSYCQFSNTLQDLQGCRGDIGNEVTGNENEERARIRLIRLCKRIADEYAEEEE